ncbi:MAG: ADOP family duplicated permease, partial [Gemmatimonadales bacterium]
MRRRLFRFPWRTAREIRADVEDELRFHIDARTESLVATGVSPDVARAQALREFGDVEDARRYIRRIDRETEAARRRSDYLGELRQDIVYAIRQLRSAPGFTITAVATLALGIGANVAIFSVISGVLIRPLPFPRAGRVIQVWSANRTGNNLHAGVSPVDLDDWRAQKQVVADIGGWFYQDDGGSGINLTGAGEPQRLGAVFVTPGFFGALAVPPQEGRLPREDEMVRGGPDKVVVLSHRFWQRQFAAQRSVVGSTVQLDGAPYQVLGVMPPEFRFPSEQADVYVPYSTIPDDAIPRLRVVKVLESVARVRDGHSTSEATSELNAIARRLALQYPDNAAYDAVTVESLQESVTGPVRRGLLVLMGAVAFVLLMACVNVASLLLARAAVREREVAIRAALGAGRGRITRQLLTESLVLSFAGAAAGLLVAAGGVRFLLSLAEGQLPRAADVRLDGAALLFTVALAIATGLIFGLLPALRASGAQLQGTLRAGGRGTAGGGAQRLRSGLVVAEVALAMILVVGSGLMMRSFVELLKVDPGFQPDHLIAVNFTISSAQHSPYQGYYHAVIDKVRLLPGVVSAGAVKNAPFRGGGERNSFIPPGMILGANEQAPVATYFHISDGYFKTIGARMVDGREYSALDRPDGPLTVVVNQALASRWFPGVSAVGKAIDLGGPGNSAEIIGVVNDIRQMSMEAPASPAIYLNNMRNNSRVKTTIVARTQADPVAMARQIREAIWSLDKNQTISSVFTFDDAMSHAVARPRLLTVLMGLFGAIGLLLGALGIYGV